MVSNTNELKVLRAQKKKILEKVMDKETYKVAVDILNKFGDKPLKTTPTQDMSGKYGWGHFTLCQKTSVTQPSNSSSGCYKHFSFTIKK